MREFGFAGGIVVHCTAGFGALAVVMALPTARSSSPSSTPIPTTSPSSLLAPPSSGSAGSDLTVALQWRQHAGWLRPHQHRDLRVLRALRVAHDRVGTRQAHLVGACVGAIAGLATVTPAAGFSPLPRYHILAAPVLLPHRGCQEQVRPRDALDVFVHGRVAISAPFSSVSSRMSGWAGRMPAVSSSGSSSGAPPSAPSTPSSCPSPSSRSSSPHARPPSPLSARVSTPIHGEKAYKENSQNGTEFANPLKAASAV